MNINNKFQPLYIANDNTITTIENNSSNLQFCEVNNSLNTISTVNLLNQNTNEDLNLVAFDGSSINPLIKINNTHQHVNITSNLNVASNLNIQNENLNYTFNDSGLTIADLDPSQTNKNLYFQYDSGNFINRVIQEGKHVFQVGDDTTNPSNLNRLIVNQHGVGIGSNINPTPGHELDIDGNTYISGNVGIGTQNPQTKLDVNGDIQFKSHNEFNNISNFFPGYYKSINSGTNIGLPLDFKASLGQQSTPAFEDYKKIIYNGMEIKMSGTTIYSKNQINGYYNGPPTGAQSSVIYNEQDVHGFYFQLTGADIPKVSSGSYVLNTSAQYDDGYIIIKLLDTAIYKNKFTEISFDIVHTNVIEGGSWYEVHIRNPNDYTDTLFKVRFGSYTGYQFVSIQNKGMDPDYLGGNIGETHFRVSSNKLAFNGITDPSQYLFFNIRLVFDDEFRIYFNNEQLVTDIDRGRGTGEKVRRDLDDNFKAYINDDSYNELVFKVSNGGAYSDVFIKNIQIKSGFGCFIST